MFFEKGSYQYDVVKTANRAKYEQNPDLKSELLETGDAILAEASPSDTIWGIGLDAAIAAEMNPSEWPGQNLLGKILMEIRAEFAAEKAHVSQIVRSPKLDEINRMLRDGLV